MSPDRPATRLAPYARLPRVYRDRHVLHSMRDESSSDWAVLDISVV
ncbi:hypothetical protein [Streptomyces sp. NBC_01483]|nr:hypothetical protein [Streptomyces sp. NBC_01483]